MKDFLARNWFFLLMAALAGLAVTNNVWPPPEPERIQPVWPPAAPRAASGPCTQWRSVLETEPAAADAPEVLALMAQFREAAIIGESDPAPAGTGGQFREISREARGIGVRIGRLAGSDAMKPVMEVTLVDLCRLVLLDHGSVRIEPDVSPKAAAASIRASLDRLSPPGMRSPIAGISGFLPLDGAPPELALKLRETVRDFASSDDELLLRETDYESLRLPEARLEENAAEPPVADLLVTIRAGRNGPLHVAHLEREYPSPGRETIEGGSVAELAENILNRMKRIAYAR
ncbi:MAG: hypothetical protein KIT79_12005 [Deltaproteobacteria bacterium]|nr:hypothetical protein [Deltaproteobacteria bacterium]